MKEKEREREFLVLLIILLIYSVSYKNASTTNVYYSFAFIVSYRCHFVHWLYRSSSGIHRSICVFALITVVFHDLNKVQNFFLSNDTKR